MHARVIAVVVGLAAAVTLTSVAASGPEAAKKQRVTITMKNLPYATFVLAPLQVGALERDSGTVRFGAPPNYNARDVIRGGQKVSIYPPVFWALTGKRGTLTIRELNEWVDIGSDGNGDGQEDGVAFGTWKVVRGTGQYAQIAGGGRSGHAGLGNPWNARQEGFLTLP
jgi:hypothetical protein